jgi:hypothetical protein
MSAQSDLFQLYEEWRAWTNSEREAIESSDWNRVTECHTAKAELQQRIVRQTQLAQEESKDDQLVRASVDRRVRSVVNELIYLETRNGEFLADRRAQAQTELDALERSGRNLGRIHKQYSQGSAAAWESYS